MVDSVQTGMASPAEADPQGEIARLSGLLREVEAEHAALMRRHVTQAAATDLSRQRFAMVLAQAVNYARLESIVRPPSSIGQRVGALVDVAVYGLATLVGFRRLESAGRVRAALHDHLPGLFARLQRLRDRPMLDLGRQDLLFSAYDTVSTDSGGSLELPNLFNRRPVRELLRRLISQMLTATETYGPVNTIYALNFYAGGGAEMITLAYARAVAKSGELVVIVMTDNGPQVPTPNLPENILVLRFGSDVPLDDMDRCALVFMLWQAATPARLHIINSEAAWRLIVAAPQDLLPQSEVFASIFALQFDSDGEPVGYASSFLGSTSDRLTALITDNHRFALEGPRRIGAELDPERVWTIPSPCRLQGLLSSEKAVDRLQLRPVANQDRMAVVWAGRLDMEKRIDLLHEIARLGQDRFDFVVFGKAVLDDHAWDERLKSLSNVRVMGGYDSPMEWDPEDSPPGAFLFTSKWEGMPNTVVEAAWMGLPIVAADVGGVRELVDAETGWLVATDASAQDYLAALDVVRANPHEGIARTQRLIARVHDRHSLSAFEGSLGEAYQSVLHADRSTS